MLNIKKLAIGISAGAIMLAASAITVFAAYSLFGDASIVGGGNPGNAAQIRSDVSVAPGYGGVDVSPVSPISWASLTTLSTDYNVTNDNCGGGSPRVSLGVDTNSDNVADGYVHIAIGPSPSFTGCAAAWQSTGNLIGNSDAGRYDYSQFGGSTFTTYANAPASVLSGNVVEAFVVVDGSWSAAATGGDSEQTVLVDNINVNGDVTTFDPVVLLGKATGGLNVGLGTDGSPRQHMSFNAFDYGNSSDDKGEIEYSNFDYSGGLHYNADVLCANVDKATSDVWFAYEIPDGHPGLSGLGIMVRVHDGGTPGKKGDTFGFNVAANGSAAVALCEAGTAPSNSYPVTGGNAVVHK